MKNGEIGWPIIDHGSTGNPDCCGCWVWEFKKTGENYITITCNECGEKRVLLKQCNRNENIEYIWLKVSKMLKNIIEYIQYDQGGLSPDETETVKKDINVVIALLNE